MARSMALVGGAQDKRQLRLEQSRADRMARESEKTKNELSQAQKRANLMQKAHEEEVRRFREEQAKQQAELEKKKMFLVTLQLLHMVSF